MKIRKHDRVEKAYSALKNALVAYEKINKENPAFLQSEENLVSCFNECIDTVRGEIRFCVSGTLAMVSQIRSINDRKTSKNQLREDIERLRNKQISLTNLLVKIKNKAISLGLANKIKAMNDADCKHDEKEVNNLLDVMEHHN